MGVPNTSSGPYEVVGDFQHRNSTGLRHSGNQSHTTSPYPVSTSHLQSPVSTCSTGNTVSGQHQYMPYRPTLAASELPSPCRTPIPDHRAPAGYQSSTIVESHSDHATPAGQFPSDEQIPAYEPPPYEQFATAGQLIEHADGRVEVDLDTKVGRALKRLIPHPPSALPPASSPRYTLKKAWEVRLNIVIQVVGSRGDVQPFVALGNELQKHGHRVRLATHNVFEDFVRDAGLEFYPIGGDPTELMAYMVKNPGLIPSMKSLRGGEIQKKRAMVKEMLDGCWKSCLEPDLKSHDPFVADAIIANPPSFAHVHCAEALGIPVHLMFTMPWSSTRAFPHPLANIKSSTTDQSVVNYISYGIVEWMTWQGLGDIINKWRYGIDLEPVPATEGPLLAETLEIPFTYCWSPALVPKPTDWPCHIDVCGFFFRDPPSYTPPPDLDNFLRQGHPPVYIGFGSIVIEDPQKMSSLILEAVRATGVRAIISRGWSKLNGPPDPNMLFLGDCPHEWLFQHVAAVVHHGGAGTTACGLLNAKPTTIVPFFGDQPFWGDMVAAAKAGPDPIPHKALTSHNLAEAIRYCLTPQAAEAARKIADKMRTESGVHRAVESFHANLPLEGMRCDIFPDRPACWRVRKSKPPIKLSNLAAEVLVTGLGIDRQNLKMHMSKPIFIENRRWDPITGGASSMIGLGSDLTMATGDVFIKPYEELKRSRADSRPTSTSSSPGPSRATTPADPSVRSSMNAPERRDRIEASDRNVTSFQDSDHEAVNQCPSNNRAGTSILSGSNGNVPSHTNVSFVSDSSDFSEYSTAPTSCSNSEFAGDTSAAVNCYPHVNKGHRPKASSCSANLPENIRDFEQTQNNTTLTTFTDNGEGSSRGVAPTSGSHNRGLHTAGAMAAASGKSVGKLLGTYTKGVFVDVPLAFTEGLRQTPSLYGEKVHDYGKITDWKSGALFAAKNLGVGFAEGMTDLFVQPVRGGMNQGAVGVAKGFGKGAVGTLAKTGSAGLGLFAYTGQGIYKSIRNSRHLQTRKHITVMRHVEAGWQLKRKPEVDREMVISKYAELRKRRKR